MNAFDEFFQDKHILPKLEHLNLTTAKKITDSDIIAFLTNKIEETCGGARSCFQRQDRIKSLTLDVKHRAFDFHNIFTSNAITEKTKTQV